MLIITAKGKIQRLKASDISTIGRNTQGVRIMKLDEGDTLSSCATIASEDIEEAAARAAEREAAETAQIAAAEAKAAAAPAKAAELDDGDDVEDDGIDIQDDDSEE